MLHMYFLWKHHLFCQNDQDSDSDWFIYCIDKWLLTLLFSQQYFDSESCFWNDNKFLFNTQPLSCFVFHLPNLLLTQNFVYPTFFSSVPPPTINNERSLMHGLSDCSDIYSIIIYLKESMISDWLKANCKTVIQIQQLAEFWHNIQRVTS
jgi:hypothetical protein